MRTKIIATYGPAIDRQETLNRVMRYVDIIRLNLSHGDQASWLSYMEKIRRGMKATGREVAVLGDLPGPKIRIGHITENVHVEKGGPVSFSYGIDKPGVIPLNMDIYGYLRKGAVLSIGDGQVDLEVTALSKGIISCTSLHTGQLIRGKGVTIRRSAMPEPPTAADRKLARFAAGEGFDFLGLSYTQDPRNVASIRKDAKGLMVIAKIERSVAVEKVEAITAVSDGIMIERGDLGLDVPLENLPVIQNLVISAARQLNKPVIVATQALTTMTDSPVPTRAEVNDVAHSVMDGADCIMLSEETAVGKYPIEALSTLSNIVAKAEQVSPRRDAAQVGAPSDAIVFAASQMADRYRTDCIFVLTRTGNTAIRLSALMPRADIIALAASVKVRKRLKMYYGVQAVESPGYRNADEMLAAVRALARKMRARNYIVVSGPLNTPVPNTLKYVSSE